MKELLVVQCNFKTVVDFLGYFVAVIQALELKTSPEGVRDMPQPRYAAMARWQT